VPPSARLVVLASGEGTNLQALLDACTDPAYGARVVAVGTDRAEAGAVRRAEEAGVPTFVVPLSEYADRDAWNDGLATHVAAHAPDLVVLAGFMKVLSPRFLARFGARVVNTHPALLPAFPGSRAVQDTLAYGAKVTGVTLHLVDAGVDTGPVIAQAVVPVLEGDDAEVLHGRIKSVERALLVETVGRMARHGYDVEGRRVRVR